MATQDELLTRHKHELVELVFELNQMAEFNAAAMAQSVLVSMDDLQEMFAEQGIGADEFEQPC